VPVPVRADTIRRRPPGVSKVMGGTVPGLLVLAASVAVFGGMFAASSPPPVLASTSKHEAVLPKVPADSGHGRRVVFDQSEQRVWLVAADGEVKRSYLVTGSKTDNVRPGEYRVNGRTRFATTYRGGGTFEYFVKFTQGRTAAIGFHAVTVLNSGRLVYTSDDLGTPRTPGCVEAMKQDAQALWKFAPLGTDVVVTA
jgi:hypothetical protein